MERATNIKDFKLISLLGSVYKLVAKVLPRRMAKVMDRVAGKCQHAFVE